MEADIYKVRPMRCANVRQFGASSPASRGPGTIDSSCGVTDFSGSFELW
jgi:hypothetical protein